MHNWLDEPAYRAYITALRDELLERTAAALVAAGTKAVATLVTLMDSANENVRLRAALGVIETMVRVREHADLTARVASLESLAHAEPIPSLDAA